MTTVHGYPRAENHVLFLSKKKKEKKTTSSVTFRGGDEGNVQRGVLSRL